MFTRRRILQTVGFATLGALSLGGYAFGIEPRRLRVQRYAVSPRGWPEGLKLKIAALADIHACKPWMPVEHIEHMVEVTNSLLADVIVLLGDYAARHRWVSELVDANDWSKALSGLKAPLGVHAILGNHDWWDDRAAQERGSGPILGRLALERAGIPVYENDATKLRKGAHAFWLAGLGDQLALLSGSSRGASKGVDDLPGLLAKVDDTAPVVLLAHEPDIFPRVPESVALTLCGHTHGGQVRLFGYSPVVPSRFGNRYAYGHVTEGSRQMIVSGGLGCSIAPVRFGVPPEIVVVEIGSSVI